MTTLLRQLLRWPRARHYPAYFIFFVTSRCNARCKMCFYLDNMAANAAKDELTVEEYEKIAARIPFINILGISGGEPFLRPDLAELVTAIHRRTRPLVVDLPTNGTFTESVVRQAPAIARSCPEMVVDLQVSIDGPPEVHNDIRGLKDGFARMRETYLAMVKEKAKLPNLKLKACVVYSAFNRAHIRELFTLLDRDFPDFDRVVFSVAHGSAHDRRSFDFDWEDYFRLCEELRANARVKSLFDLHSLFTQALRMAKNRMLSEVIDQGGLCRFCGAGSRVVVVGETGLVYPCEPLWLPVGDLRKSDYDLGRVLESPAMAAFKRSLPDRACECHWGLVMSTAILYRPKYYAGIAADMLRIAARSLGR